MGRNPGGQRRKYFRNTHKAGRAPKDLDQIYEEAQELSKREDEVARGAAPPAAKKARVKGDRDKLDTDLPALGEYYCLSCARYFASEHALQSHTRTKAHKRRLKELQREVPYGVDADEVRGMKADNGGKRRRGDDVEMGDDAAQ